MQETEINLHRIHGMEVLTYVETEQPLVCFFNIGIGNI